MTENEFAALSKTIAGLWPRWGLNPERGQMLWGMLGSYEHQAVGDAVRRAFHEDPDSTKPPLKLIRSYLQGAERHRGMDDKLQKEIDEHREHYAGWSRRGWKYPGDDAIKGFIARNEATPLQQFTFKRIAAAIRDGIEGKPLGMDDDQMYGDDE